MHRLLSLSLSQICANCTVELENNKGPRDWQNVLNIMKSFISRFSFIHTICYYYLGQEYHSEHRGLCYIEVCYIEVPL